MAAACWRSFIGDPSNFTHLTTDSSLYYNLTAPTWMSWSSVGCTVANDGLCEIPITYYGCALPPPAQAPPSPPPSPPSPALEISSGKACPPPDNDARYCPGDLASCYFMSVATASLANAKAACATLNGSLVSWGSYAEQSQVGQPAAQGSASSVCPQCRGSRRLHARQLLT